MSDSVVVGVAPVTQKNNCKRFGPGWDPPCQYRHATPIVRGTYGRCKSDVQLREENFVTMPESKNSVVAARARTSREKRQNRIGKSGDSSRRPIRTGGPKPVRIHRAAAAARGPRSAGGGSRPSQGPKRVALTPCVQEYMAFLASPFAHRGLVCNPGGPSPPSMKIRAFQTITIGVGTSGFGWALVAPSPWSDAPCIWYTDTTWPGNRVQPFQTNGAVQPGVFVLSCPSLPFSMSQGLNGLVRDSAGEVTGDVIVSARVNGCGLQLAYIGTTLNLSGINQTLRSSAHTPVNGFQQADGSYFLNVPQVGSFPQSKVCPTTREHCSVIDFPAVPSESEYGGAGSSTQSSEYQVFNTAILYPYSRGAQQPGIYSTVPGINVTTAGDGGGALVTRVNYGCGTTLFTVQGQPGNQYFGEYTISTEYTGIITQSVSTPSHSDPVGTARLLKAAADAPALQRANPRQTMFSAIMDGLSSVAKEVVPVVVPMLERAFMASLL